MNSYSHKIVAALAAVIVVAMFGYIVTRAGLPADAAVAVGGDKGEVTLKVAVNPICVPESQEITLNQDQQSRKPSILLGIGGSPTSLGEEFYITEVEISDAVNSNDSSKFFTLVAEDAPYNGYTEAPSSVAPGKTQIRPLVKFTTPEVSFDDESEVYVSTVKARAREYMKSGEWGTVSPVDMFEAETTIKKGLEITVEHKNHAPNLFSISSSSVESDTNKFNLEVTSDVDDTEGNDVDIVFELSKDNFETIYKEYTYESIDLPSNQPYRQKHTFKDLEEGKYKWRAKSVETGKDVVATCKGSYFEIPAEPLISNQPEEEVTLTSTISTLPLPTPEPSDDTETLVSGFVFIDEDNDLKYGKNEKPVPNVDVIIKDSEKTDTIVTDDTGSFIANVPEGEVRIEVDRNDSDIPENYVDHGPVVVRAALGTSTSTSIPLTGTLSNTGRNILPYAAFGAVVLVAGVVYITKNFSRLSKRKK